MEAERQLAIGADVDLEREVEGCAIGVGGDGAAKAADRVSRRVIDGKRDAAGRTGLEAPGVVGAEAMGERVDSGRSLRTGPATCRGAIGVGAEGDAWPLAPQALEDARQVVATGIVGPGRDLERGDLAAIGQDEQSGAELAAQILDADDAMLPDQRARFSELRHRIPPCLFP